MIILYYLIHVLLKTYFPSTWWVEAEDKKNGENKQENCFCVSSLVFNKTCIKQNLLPKYTNICLYIYIYIFNSIDKGRGSPVSR